MARFVILGSMLLGLFLPAGCSSDQPAAAGGAPNVVLIVLDTQRADCLGCYGDHRGLTPNIDGLAADGVVFERTWCPTPITGPSHTTLFTSRYPTETGIVNNSRGEIPPTMPTMAELLSGNGYATGASVSIGPIIRKYGFARGFDRYEDELGLSWIVPAHEALPVAVDVLDGLQEPFFLWSHFADPHEPYDAHGLAENRAVVKADGRFVTEIPTSTYTPTVVTLILPGDTDTQVVLEADHRFTVRRVSLRTPEGKRLQWKDGPESGATADRHVFTLGKGPRKVEMTVAINDHIAAREPRLARYGREVSYADRHVGALLDTLRARGLYDDSLIILAGDHGEGMGDHGHIGHVHDLYDSMMRVPLVIKPPRGSGFKPGSRRTDAAGLVDVLPTVLAGVGVPAHADFRGRDLLGAGSAKASPLVFLETHPPAAKRALYGLTDGRMKVIHAPDEDAWELYDLKRDPGEKNNLYRDDDKRSREWRRLLEERRAELEQAGEDSAPAGAVDEHTRELLKSLGY